MWACPYRIEQTQTASNTGALRHRFAASPFSLARVDTSVALLVEFAIIPPSGGSSVAVYTTQATLRLAFTCFFGSVMSSTKSIDSQQLTGASFTSTWKAMDACLAAFDKNCDGSLNFQEFKELSKALFRDSSGNSYAVKESLLEEIFQIFDKNGDGQIDRDEFAICWNNWIKTIVKPISALLIIDVQNDFICGTLDIRNCSAKHNGEDVVKPINDLLDSVEFDAVFYSHDWHPDDHVSFVDNLHLREIHESSQLQAEDAKVFDTVVFDGNPPVVQRLWPRHCVQNTWGSELYKDLKVVENGIKIYKGTNPEIDSYSAFWDNCKLTDTRLEAQLKAKNITDVYVCGIAYDVCVGATAIDAIVSGFRTILLDDCSRGVDLLDIEKTKNNITSHHGIIVTSDEVKDLVKGINRRPELGYKLALNLKGAENGS